MGLYKRGKIYWYTIMHDGRRIQQSTGSENKKLAEKIFAMVYTDIIEGRYFESVKAKQITFEAMVTKYMSKHEKPRDKYSVKQLLPVFGHMTLDHISTELISDYMDERLEVVKLATVYQELSLMRRMYNVARREWQWVKENPVADLSFAVGKSNARTRWLSPEEERMLLERATNSAWLRTLIVFALHTGMRKGEILELQWKSVDFQRSTITFEHSKNGEKRTIPMSRTVKDTLTAIKVRDISGRVFPRSDSSVRHAFDQAIQKAGINDFHFHDLRHTYATRLVQHGEDIFKVKTLLGHKSMAMRYSHHCADSLRTSGDILDLCYNYATLERQQVDVL